MSEQKRLGDNGTSAATAKESGDRGDEMDEKDGQVAHLANVLISTSVTRLGTRWDLCDKSGIRHRQRGDAKAGVALAFMQDLRSTSQSVERSSSSMSSPKWASNRSSSASPTGTRAGQSSVIRATTVRRPTPPL
jgi:hypothetical protein